MCGIIGFVSDETHSGIMDKKDFITQGLIVDALRGQDATGIFCVHHRRPHKKKQGVHVGWLKQAVVGSDFVDTNDYRDYHRNMSDYKFFVGHNRASTVGADVTENAHPFCVGAITMVHNGTLRGNGGLPKSQDELKLSVDSHAIAWNLNDIGHSPKAVMGLIRSLLGGFALVWHDDRDDSLNVVRNSERPFHFAQAKGKKTVFFASEAHLLRFLDGRIRMNLEEIVFPKPGLWLKFKGGNVLEPEVRVIDLAKTYTPGGVYSGYTNYHGYDDDGDTPYEVRRPRRVPAREPWPEHPGSVTVSEHTNKISIGGSEKMREIPQLCQEEIQEFGLVVEDRLKFLPVDTTKIYPQEESGVSITGDWCTVSGFLEDHDLAAVVYRTTQDTADNNFDHRWTVRPITVRHMQPTDGGATVPVVVCRLVSTRLRGDLTGPTRPEADGASVSLNTKATVRGPGNKMIRLAEWYRLTSKGCHECQTTLSLLDAHSITWSEGLVNEGGTQKTFVRAYCGKCKPTVH